MPPKKDQENIIDELSKFDASEELPAPVTQSREPAQESNPLLEDAPAPSQQQQFNQQYTQSFQQQSLQPSTEEFQQLAESIIDEKFAEFQARFGDLSSWKERMNNDVSAIKQEVLRTQDRFLELQKALMGKVNEYNENISNVNTEMKALEKVFEKILEPLTANIKELKSVTEKLKDKTK